jgi:hypothetical protein
VRQSNPPVNAAGRAIGDQARKIFAHAQFEAGKVAA